LDIIYGNLETDNLGSFWTPWVGINKKTKNNTEEKPPCCHPLSVSITFFITPEWFCEGSTVFKSVWIPDKKFQESEEKVIPECMYQESRINDLLVR